MSQRTTKASLVLLLEAMIAGTQKHFPTGSLTVGNTSYTATSIDKLLQSLVDATSAMDDAHKAWQQAVLEQRAIAATVRPFVKGYSSYLRATFGAAVQTLADFGLSPIKARTPSTVQKKAAAAEKRLATREARHTMGAKQKADIKGTPPATTTGSTAVAAPAAPAKTA